VRDLLLHREHDDPWLGVPDLDLVVEPADLADARDHAAQEPSPAQRLARRLRQRLEPERLVFYQEHGAYGTVELEVMCEGGPVLLDVASARREHYPEAALNPLVEFGRLEDDLARRDFTINAMALRLEPGAPRLLDPHSGRADLGQRRLRFLHDASVRDDPTRVLRGARYAARMGFALAPESLAQLHDTLASWPWRWRPGDPPGQAPPALGTRLRMELELLLAREPWERALAALQQWGALLLLDARLQADRHWRRRLDRAARLGLPLPAALVAGADDPLELAERLQLPHRQHRLLEQFLRVRDRLAEAGLSGLHQPPACQDWPPSRWCALLEAPGASPEAVALALAAGIGPRRPLLRWWLRWRHLKAPVTAADLIEQEGLRQGPALGERLRALRIERLDAERC
jgi:poly(A) polymerase